MHSLEKLQTAWGTQGYSPTQVPDADLAALEQAMNFGFPKSYRGQVVAFGLPRIKTKLWDWLTDREDTAIARYGFTLALMFKPSPPHLSNFFTPNEIQEALSWRDLGLPEHLLPFAYDSSGNLFCFVLTILGASPGAQSPVYY
ncbi:SMI1/KNR4 family protein [Epibacterium ulvae]|nr:SMI1/KNR4 family protein [Epibacterium ulvae]